MARAIKLRNQGANTISLSLKSVANYEGKHDNCVTVLDFFFRGTFLEFNFFTFHICWMGHKHLESGGRVLILPELDPQIAEGAEEWNQCHLILNQLSHIDILKEDILFLFLIDILLLIKFIFYSLTFVNNIRKSCQKD